MTELPGIVVNGVSGRMGRMLVQVIGESRDAAAGGRAGTRRATNGSAATSARLWAARRQG
jgi:dihydrodipicolinate reductase